MKERIAHLNAISENAQRDNAAHVEQRKTFDQQMRQAMELVEKERQVINVVQTGIVSLICVTRIKKCFVLENTELTTAVKTKIQESQSLHEKYERLSAQFK